MTLFRVVAVIVC